MRRPRTRTRDLTPRESQLLELLATGVSTMEAAALMGITESTAERHRSHVYAKLHVYNRTGLLAEAKSRGLIGGRA